MTFHRSIVPGYERARVLNPWVFANYGQPQRRRGYVSPVVYQTRASMPESAYLGAADDTGVPLSTLVPPTSLVSSGSGASSDPDEPIKIMRRMQVLSFVSVIVGAAGLLFAVSRRK